MISQFLPPAVRHLLIVILTCLVVGSAIYANVLLRGEFNYDDIDYVVNNTFIRDMSHFRNVSELRYVGYLTFALNYLYGGLEPRNYHFFNILIHIANAVVVYLLASCLIRLTRREEGQEVPAGDWAIPFAATVVFLTHPLATQSVSYISQRFSSLSTLFYLSAVLLYLSGRERHESGASVFNPRLVLAFGCACLGIKTKETVFTLPAMLTILEWVFFRTETGTRGKRWLILLPFYATMLIVPLSLYGPELGLFETVSGISERTRGEKLLDLDTRSRTEYLLTQFRVIVTYLRLMVAPYGQRVIYDYPRYTSILSVPVILSFLLLASIAWGGWRCLQRSFRTTGTERVETRLTGLGILWFFVTISVESSIIPIKDVIFEHRTYLPSFGAYLAMIALISMGVRRYRPQYKPVALVLVFLLIGGLLGMATYQRNRVWLNCFAFWDDAVRKEPGLPIVWQNRAWSYLMVAGIPDEALHDLNKSIELAEERYARGTGNSDPADALMQMAKAYEDRVRVNGTLGNMDAVARDTKKMEEYLDELRRLTGLDYQSDLPH